MPNVETPLTFAQSFAKRFPLLVGLWNLVSTIAMIAFWGLMLILTPWVLLIYGLRAWGGKYDDHRWDQHRDIGEALDMTQAFAWLWKETDGGAILLMGPAFIAWLFIIGHEITTHELTNKLASMFGT